MAHTTSIPKPQRRTLNLIRRGGSRQADTPMEERTSRMKRILAWTLLLAIPLITVLGALGSTAAHADDDDAMKYSFYKIASSTTAFFSTVQEPDSGMKFSEEWTQMLDDPGSAGSLLGYADPDFSSVSGWLASKLSGSSDAIGYDTLRVRDEGEDGKYSGSNYQGMVDYAYFGAALNGLGLDGTNNGLALGFMNWITAGIMMVLFILGGAVDFLFNSIIGVLSLLNPFKLFYLGVEAINPTLAGGMVGDGGSDVGPLSGLASWIGGWYQTLVSLSWGVMVPIFIGVLVFSLILFKKLDRGGAVKKLIVRLFFIGLGLPLLGTMYTGVLDTMSDTSVAGNSGSTRVVMSTYLDFEKWALNSRLAVPAGAVIEWDTGTDAPSSHAQAQVRNTALAINNQTLSLNLSSIVSANSYDASFANQIMQGQETDKATPALTFTKTVDLLGRYMNGAQVSAASFETISKGNLTQSSYFRENSSGTVKDWFESLTKSAKDLNKEDPRNNPIVAVKDGTGLRANGPQGIRQFTSTTSGCSVSGTMVVASDGAPRACNLSPLAMYNYLNSDFDSTSMRMYSSSNVASEATRMIHNSVNQVGTGSMSFLYWLNAVVLLGSFVIIGFGYGFGLLFGSIRRSFQLATAVPFATLGAIAGIAKVVVYAVALILEVLVTIFVYKLVQEFLTSLPQLIEMPFSAVLNNGAAGDLAGFIAFLVAGPGFALVVTILSIIGVTVFSVLALRVRKSFVKAIEEAVTKLVEKFMETQVGMPGGGKLTPALAGGLASGAGGAMASRMMNKHDAKGKSPAVTLTGNNGPASVSTAGGTTEMGYGQGGQGGDQGALPAGGEGSGSDGGGRAPVGPGNGDAGTPMGVTAGGGASDRVVSDEVALGRNVETNGLTKPSEPRAPQVGDDALSAASKSMDDSRAGYQAADRKRLEGGKEGAKAVGHGAAAVGRGIAGDGAGAAESGGRALQHGGAAVASSEEGKQMRADAGRSSLDKPDNRHLRAANNARQVSAVGGNVAAAAGTVNGAGGAKQAPRPTGGTSTAPAVGPRPASPKQVQAPRQAPAPGRAPQAPAAPRPVAPRSAPRPVAPPTQQPKDTAPRALKPAPGPRPASPAKPIKPKTPKA